MIPRSPAVHGPPLALLATLASLVLPAAAGAATPVRFFAGTPVDGPSADIQSLGDLDVARDGTGALTYVKRVGGVDHVFVSRLVNGAFQAPEQVDAGLAGAGAQPVVAASDGGRLVVAFVSGGGIFTAVRPAGAPGFAALQPIAAAGSDPAVEMSINGVAYLAYSAAGDLQAARLERNATSFNGLPGPLDINPAATAGTDTGRPKVAVAADGVATVVWGESGNVYARRLFELRPSTAPQDVGEGADAPDISSEDDSSYAWVVFRQGGAVARRLVGSQFDPPVPIESAEGADAPRVAINGRGVGYAGVGGAGSLNAYGAVLKDDLFNPAVMIGASVAGAVPAAVPAAAESGDGLVAYQQGDASGARSIHARPYDYVAASRAVTPPGPDATLSDPALGPTDAARGLEAAADRAGDIAVAFVQGDGDTRRIVAGSYDRAPGAFRASTTTKWRKFARPPLKWGTAFELWGPLTYQVQIDGQPVGADDVHGPHRADPRARRAASLAGRRDRHPRPGDGDADAQPARRRDAAQGQLQGLGHAQARQAGEGRREGHRRQRHGREGLGADGRADLVRRRLADLRGAAGGPSLRALGQGHASASARATRPATWWP